MTKNLPSLAGFFVQFIFPNDCRCSIWDKFGVIQYLSCFPQWDTLYLLKDNLQSSFYQQSPLTAAFRRSFQVSHGLTGFSCPKSCLLSFRFSINFFLDKKVTKNQGLKLFPYFSHPHNYHKTQALKL